jgi:hypothetical protein
MSENKQYGVIHELGDYSGFKQLNDKDNKDYNQQLLEEQQRKQEERKNSTKN